ADSSRGVAAVVGRALRDSGLGAGGAPEISATIGGKDNRDPSYGGFIGYNSQWENVVLGIEANYNHTSFAAVRPGSLNLNISPGNGLIYHTTVDGGVSLQLTDYGTLRGRAGYAMGSFMPYLMAGAAFGRVEINRF